MYSYILSPYSLGFFHMITAFLSLQSILCTSGVAGTSKVKRTHGRKYTNYWTRKTVLKVANKKKGTNNCDIQISFDLIYSASNYTFYVTSMPASNISHLQRRRNNSENLSLSFWLKKLLLKVALRQHWV